MTTQDFVDVVLNKAVGFDIGFESPCITNDPYIFIDDKNLVVNDEKSEEIRMYLITEILEALENSIKSSKGTIYETAIKNAELNIKSNINALTYRGNIGRYIRFHRGPFFLYFDVTTNDIYYYLDTFTNHEISISFNKFDLKYPSIFWDKNFTDCKFWTPRDPNTKSNPGSWSLKLRKGAVAKP